MFSKVVDEQIQAKVCFGLPALLTVGTQSYVVHNSAGKKPLERLTHFSHEKNMNDYQSAIGKGGSLFRYPTPMAEGERLGCLKLKPKTPPLSSPALLRAALREHFAAVSG